MAEQMSKADRTELRRILKARFELLDKRIRVRQQEVRGELNKRVRAQYDDRIKLADKELTKLQKRAEKLKEEARGLEEQMRDQGLVPTGRFSKDPLIDFDIATGWEPADLSERVGEAWDELTNHSGRLHLQLDEQKLELEEELASGSLKSEEAQKFLEKIPTVDDLLPLPNGDRPQERKQLSS